MVPPVPDWSDVVDLNFGNPELWYYMAGAMKFWVEEIGVDGFRCDVAGMVPLEFWNYVRAELETVKPVFMLAEWEAPEAHDFAFDMTYAWGFHHLMAKIAKGVSPASSIGGYLEGDARKYPRSAYRMYFTSNHDENSWNGTVYERMGEGAIAMAVLSATLNGMPLVYSGQEVGLDKRLEFFEKDLIPWREHVLTQFYATLLNLKRENRALWNGDRGGDVRWIHTSNDHSVFAFTREKEGDRVLVALNFSPDEQTVTPDGTEFTGEYRDVFLDEEATLAEGDAITLEPWGFLVLSSTAHGRGLLPFRRTHGNLGVAAQWMTGSFSSRAQAMRDTNYFDIRLEMKPIWLHRSDGYWLYVEQAVATHLDKPYRQRVYHLTEQADGSVRSDIYTIPDPLRFAGAWREQDPLGGLTPDSLSIKEGCEVILKRVSDDTFRGGTVGQACPSTLKGASYATSDVRLTENRLVSWDRGFGSDGKPVWGAQKGGYVFEKVGSGN
jgi:hypothetical protein